MADVKIVDIDSEQWNIKDQYARQQIATINENISEIKTKQNKIIDIQGSTSSTYINICTAEEFKTLLNGKVGGIDISYISFGQGSFMYKGLARINITGTVQNVANIYTVSGTTAPTLKIADGYLRFDVGATMSSYALKLEIF